MQNTAQSKQDEKKRKELEEISRKNEVKHKTKGIQAMMKTKLRILMKMNTRETVKGNVENNIEHMTTIPDY